SGPGISKNRTNISLYNNRDNIVFFSQMVRETIKLNENNPYFSGIILNIKPNNINEKAYYETLKGITDRIIKDYSYPIFITLDGNFLSSENAKLPNNIFTSELIGYNVDMSIDCDSYPGKGTINGVEGSISKNSILDKLINIKQSEEDSTNFMVSYKSKWNDNCDVLIKDIFEIMKMLGFQFNLSYSNTNNEYDFTNHKNILNIIQKF
ncbi:MAG: hypothetical protein RSA01_03860, partial [Clostridium sp.]